jgi:hypothetical protein
MATTPSVVDVYPAPNAIGIAIGDRVYVIFDQEMDRESINDGTFVVIGPDQELTFGPDLSPLDSPRLDDEDIMSSPYVGGYVQGTITFARLDAYNSEIDEDTKDYTGAGNLWRTQAIFTPDQPLQPNKQYTVFVLGDENATDNFDSGVRTRTVFDIKEESVSGSGVFVPQGGYRGTNTRTYHIKITQGGPAGTATYEWWDASTPLITYDGLTTTGLRELEDGLGVICEPDGVFTTGDEWTIVCKKYILLPSNYKWLFTTGGGSITTPPSTGSTSGITTLDAAPGLEIISVTPKDKATHLDPDSVTEIVIVFNKALDDTTITDDTVLVWTEPVNGDPSIEAEGVLAKILDVSGNTLTIQIS